MQLTQETLAVLKNFSAINQSLIFKAGNVIKTKSTASDVMASATVTEEFPSDFAIYELGRFLSVISLFDNPTLDFHDNYVTIGGAKSSVNYIFADSSLISGANYDKHLTLPSTVGQFVLKQADLLKLQKGASTLGIPNITVSSKDGVLTVVAHDKKNPNSDKFVLDLSDDAVKHSSDFSVDLKLDTLKFLPGDYSVTVTERVICVFENTSGNVVYYVAGDVSTK